MQLFSADVTMFSKIFFFFFAHKKLKKPPSKVAHNRPKPFIPQPSPTHSQQPKIDFSYHKNVPPSVSSLVCGMSHKTRVHKTIFNILLHFFCVGTLLCTQYITSRVSYINDSLNIFTLALLHKYLSKFEHSMFCKDKQFSWRELGILKALEILQKFS